MLRVEERKTIVKEHLPAVKVAKISEGGASSVVPEGSPTENPSTETRKEEPSSVEECGKRSAEDEPGVLEALYGQEVKITPATPIKALESKRIMIYWADDTETKDTLETRYQRIPISSTDGPDPFQLYRLPRYLSRYHCGNVR